MSTSLSKMATIYALWRLQADVVMEQLAFAECKGHAQQLLYVLNRIDLIWTEVYGEEYTQEKTRMSELLSQIDRGAMH